MNAIYDDMIWAGVSYRPGDAVAPVLGFQYRTIKKSQILQRTSFQNRIFIRCNYFELQTYSDGSHEVFLSYGFMFESTPILNKYSNPRFL